MLALLLALTLVGPPPSAAVPRSDTGVRQHDLAPPTLVQRYDVAPGIVREVHAWATAGGGQHVEVVRVRTDDPRIELTTEIAGGVIPGTETPNETAARLGPSAAVVINGGFWLSDPWGDPEGVVIRDGAYLSEPATRGGGPRGAFALFPDGSWDVARPVSTTKAYFHGGAILDVAAVNRRPAEKELVLMTPGFAATSGAADDAVEIVLTGPPVTIETTGVYEILEVRAPGGPLADGDAVLVARGKAAARLTGLEPGDWVYLEGTFSEPWADATQGLTAGPLLIDEGVETGPADWEREGFAPSVHNDRAHPRSVIARTRSGETLLIALDGRQPGWSVGASIAELKELLIDLDAIDALALDGGGSTQLVVDGVTENRPSDGGPRRVATSIVIRTRSIPDRIARIEGTSRYATSRNLALAGWPDGSGEVVIASGADFPDGLAGGALAADLDAPLLLTAPDELSPDTATALAELGATHVTLLGGPAAIDDDVVRQLGALGLGVSRLYGEDRMATAVAIAIRRDTMAASALPLVPRLRSTTALLASAWAWPDALAAAVPGHVTGAPVLLTRTERLMPTTLAALHDLDITDVVVVGGPAALSEEVVAALRAEGFGVERVAGPDRYATATGLAAWSAGLTGRPSHVVLSTGRAFSDALVAGPYAARTGGILLLAQRFSLDETTTVGPLLDHWQPDRFTLVGGAGAMRRWIAWQLEERLG